MNEEKIIDINIGLTDDEVEQRKSNNLVNNDTSVPTKSIKRILIDNFFTLFNFLNLFLGIALFLVGSYKNMFFLLIAIINTAISTFQEIHSKRIIDKLSIMASSKAIVIRNGKHQEISIYDLVLDDIVELNTGNQISADSLILDGEVQVNESFITGEPDLITKHKGDKILSGSFIVSGKCIAQIEHIGSDNYTAKISSGAKYIKKVNSEIMTSLKKIIKFLSFIIIPLGIILFYRQLQLPDITIQHAVEKTVAAVIAMIPEGLVLLTSTVLAVSVIRLSRSKVLVQELYCIETLARVDTLCLDKTGTLTEGTMEVKDIVPINKDKKEIENILANIGLYSQDNNSTIEAIRNKYPEIKEKWTSNSQVPFSSQTKWSGINFENNGSYVIGAPEFVLKNNFSNYEEQIKSYTKDYRVLVLSHSSENFENKQLPNSLDVIGLILISDKIRKEASNTLAYFENQGVDIKIISGDNPITVSQIAKQVGIKDYDKYIDLSTISDKENIQDIVTKYTIFGRVSPTQKEAIVLALQEKGKTVAMTGDGVNDVLALKKADCSIAMANGSDATKSVSQLILLDSNFASMPKVVSEGRRTINNIERSASLFLVKTIYSTILAFLFLFIGTAYPFAPIQLSLISIVTIGIPSFILALEPNKERIHGNFMKNILSRALPCGLTVVINIIVLSVLRLYNVISSAEYSTLCVIATGISGIILLFTLAKSRKSENSKLPFSIFRLLLAIILSTLFIAGLTLLDWWFTIVPLVPLISIIIKIILISLLNFTLLSILFYKILKI